MCVSVLGGREGGEERGEREEEEEGEENVCVIESGPEAIVLTFLLPGYYFMYYSMCMSVCMRI